MARCSDPDDNMFLECAQAANADYVVTGNSATSRMGGKKTAVIGPWELIELPSEAGLRILPRD